MRIVRTTKNIRITRITKNTRAEIWQRRASVLLARLWVSKLSRMRGTAEMIVMIVMIETNDEVNMMKNLEGAIGTRTR
jgi:hypothetical protein